MFGNDNERSECDAKNCKSIKSDSGQIVVFYEADYKSCVSVNAIFFCLYCSFSSSSFSYFFRFLSFIRKIWIVVGCSNCYGCCRIALSISFGFSHCRNIHKILHVLPKWIRTDNPVEKSVSERSSVETVVRFSSTYGFRNKITKTKTVFVFLSNGRLINRCSNEFKNIGSSIQINLFLFIFVLLLFWCHYYLFGNEFGQEKGLYSLHFVNRFKFSGQFRSKF